VHARQRIRRRWRRVPVGVAAIVAGAALGTVVSGANGAAGPPPPCNDVPQINDVTNDGHHGSSDVLAAWFSEAAGRLQAVIKVKVGSWVAEHEDPEIPGSGYAFLFTAGGQVRYVRATTPGPATPSDPVTYDYGTYTRAGGFATAGATTGSTITATGGTVTIDVPAATGATAGTRLASPFVLTYDGITGGQPAWVDRAPGGTSPDEAAYGADYVVGSCVTPTTGTTPTETTPTGTTPTDTTPLTTNAVQLTARSTVTGGGTITVSGRVFPARAGVPVTLTRTAKQSVNLKVTTKADGTFSAKVPIQETTELRAVAEGIGSQTLTVTVRTTVKVKVTRGRDGSAVVTGTVRPKLPGRVLWLRSTSITASAKTTTSRGTFRLRLKHPRRGRYQAVVIPTGGRAERATSNTGVIR
jgi:hypothetical protein